MPQKDPNLHIRKKKIEVGILKPVAESRGPGPRRRKTHT